MSVSMSWGKRPQVYTDEAILTIRRCVSIMRMRGYKGKKSYPVLSSRLRVTHRRVKALLEDDGSPVVRADEWNRLRQPAGDLYLEEAARLRQLATVYEVVGIAMKNNGNTTVPTGGLALVGDRDD